MKILMKFGVILVFTIMASLGISAQDNKNTPPKDNTHRVKVVPKDPDKNPDKGNNNRDNSNKDKGNKKPGM
ncbi:MAG: hypothetical protein ABI954_03840 [Pyrinomonadaceae bacterium]